jgi:hypothetical protein
MKIVTCISNQNQIGYVHALKASCAYFKLELITLFVQGGYNTHRLKTKYLRNYLETVDPDEVVFFTDGYDAIMVAEQEEILEKYHRLSPDDQILMSADRLCGDCIVGPEHFEKTQSGYHYMCTGGYIGKTAKLIEIIDLIYKDLQNDTSQENVKYFSDDHYEWTKYYLYDKSKIILDYNCEIFQTLTSDNMLQNIHEFHDIKDSLAEDENLYLRPCVTNTIAEVLEELEITQEGRILNKTTQTFPVQIHFNSEVNKLIMFMEPFVQLIDKVNQ